MPSSGRGVEASKHYPKVSKQPPAISIVVPVYKAESSLGKCLSSITSQTFRDFEIIAVDDASPDNCSTILETAALKDERLVVIAKPKNEGVHAARKTGIARSRGRYIAFADSDDWLEPKMLEKLYTSATASGADITLCGARTVDQTGKRLGLKVRYSRRTIEGAAVFQKFCDMRTGSATLWNKLYKREIIEPEATRDWDWQVSAGEDTLVNIGCFAKSTKIETIPEVLYNYVIHQSSATQSAGKALGYARMLRAYATAVKFYKTLDKESLNHIDLLYRKQLNLAGYHVKDPEELQPHAELLTEAVRILATERPEALYKIANLGIFCPSFDASKSSIADRLTKFAARAYRALTSQFH